MTADLANSNRLANLPIGRRASRGKRRWYLVHAPNKEQATCDKLRKVISPDLLEDAFVMRKERWRKVDGSWVLLPVPMYEEYLFVVTSDVVELDKALSQLTFSARITQTDGKHYAPLSTDAQAWYEEALDQGHVLRNSVAVIQDGVLHVQEGPLVGQESRIKKIDRHRRDCVVAISDGAGGEFTEYAPLEVPFKS